MLPVFRRFRLERHDANVSGTNGEKQRVKREFSTLQAPDAGSSNTDVSLEFCHLVMKRRASHRLIFFQVTRRINGNLLTTMGYGGLPRTPMCRELLGEE